MALTKSHAVITIYMYIPGLKKTLILAFPLDKQLSNFACPGQVLVFCFLYSVEDNFPDPFPTGQVKMKSYLPAGKSTCLGRPDFTFFGALYT